MYGLRYSCICNTVEGYCIRTQRMSYRFVHIHHILRSVFYLFYYTWYMWLVGENVQPAA